VVTRWVGPDGRRCRPGTPGARKVREESRKWYAFGLPGRSSPVPLATNRRVAEALFARLVAGGEAEAAGLTPESRVQTVEELAEQWRQELLDAGNTATHCDRYQSRVLSVCRARDWRFARQITAAGVQAELAARMRAEGADNIGPQTRNHYVTALRAFVRWLAGRGRRLVPADLLDGLEMLPVEVDLRHARRSLTVEELGRLLVGTMDSGQDLRGLSAARRHLLYATACATGFRAGELASLTPNHLDLDGAGPAALMPARRGKARRTARQPLPPDVAALLRSHVAGLDDAARLWPGNWHERAAEMLALDLERVGIPYAIDTPDGPLYADFHALRHTYVSLLEAAGVSLRDAMQLARHTDPRLTLARYGRSRAEELARAVQGLPVLGQPAAPDDAAEAILASWVVMGWAWFLAFGCPTGCPPGCPPDSTPS